jgi:APA family basic amino acid/polyamine antiporter
MAVALCMLIMRLRAPELERRFRTPAAWLVGAIAIFGCAYLFYSLPQTTQIYFLCAHVVGLAIYFVYGSRKSVAGRQRA